LIVLEEGMGTWSYRDQENNDWLWLVWEFLAGRRRKLADLGVFKRGGGEIGGPEENKKKVDTRQTEQIRWDRKMDIWQYK